MREILFRGKALFGDQKWCYGHHIKHEVLEGYSIYTVAGGHTMVIPETVGQYTGLKDVNGVKIFEGDTVKIFDHYNEIWTTDSAEVVFSYNYAGGWVVTKDYKTFLNIGTRTKHIKIIGNIHEEGK